jgi:hypothetical protein
MVPLSTFVQNKFRPSRVSNFSKIILEEKNISDDYSQCCLSLPIFVDDSARTKKSILSFNEFVEEHSKTLL